MRRQFGHGVWKVSVNAGCSCPNVDGTVGRGGCLFCNTESFAPSRRLSTGLRPVVPLREQIEEGIRRLRRRYVKAERFIAYFQPSTNTYAPVERLESLYREALAVEGVVGLAIGTRPDALPDDVLDLLRDIAETHWLQLEIGLQSIHAKSLDFLRRGHDYATFLGAFERARRRKLRLGVHLILGIPGESRDEMRETAGEMARLRPDGLKLHHLYVVRDTPLAALWRTGTLKLPTLDEYAATVVDFLERIPPETVIERLSGEASEEYLLAPGWTRIKHAARNAVDLEFRRRDSFQGCFRDLLPTERLV